MPDFVPLTKNVDIRDKPRRLTKDEISLIARKFPLLENIPVKYAQFIMEQIARVIRKQLKTVSIAPSKVSRLVELLIQNHQRALIAPGQAKGFEVSSSITSNLMQMALDSFKVTGGISSQTATIPAIERLIAASKTRTNTFVAIAFKKINGRRITIGEARKLHGSFVTTNVGSLLKTFDVGNGYNIRSIPIPKYLSIAQVQQEDWARNALILSPLPEAANCRLVLRLQFDTVKLVKFQVTLRKILSVLKVVNGSENLHFISSPQVFGIIDVYVPSINLSKDRIKLATFFSILPNVIISKIPSVINYMVSDMPLFSFSEKPIYVKEKQMWKIKLNEIQCKHHGVTVEDFAYLFSVLNWKHEFTPNKPSSSASLLLHREKKIFVSVPEKFGKENPVAVVENIIRYQRKILYEMWEKKLLKTPMRSSIIDAASIVVGTLELTKNSAPNLDIIYDHPLVDFRYSYSNDIHEICAIFGINAARSRLIYALNSALKGDVDLRQLNLAADAICNNKKLLGLTFNGASERLGSWSKALFETPVESLVSGALVNAKENNEGVFASYTVGDEIKVGTGSVFVSTEAMGAHQFNDRFYANTEDGEIELTDFVDDENNELAAEITSSARKYNAVSASTMVQPHRYSSRRRLISNKQEVEFSFSKIVPFFNDFSDQVTNFDFTLLTLPFLDYLSERKTINVTSNEINMDNYLQLYFTQGANKDVQVRLNFTTRKSSFLITKKNSISYQEVLRTGKMPFSALTKRKVTPMATFNFFQSFK